MAANFKGEVFDPMHATVHYYQSLEPNFEEDVDESNFKSILPSDEITLKDCVQI